MSCNPIYEYLHLGRIIQFCLCSSIWCEIPHLWWLLTEMSSLHLPVFIWTPSILPPALSFSTTALPTPCTCFPDVSTHSSCVFSQPFLPNVTQDVLLPRLGAGAGDQQSSPEPSRLSLAADGDGGCIRWAVSALLLGNSWRWARHHPDWLTSWERTSMGGIWVLYSQKGLTFCHFLEIFPKICWSGLGDRALGWGACTNAWQWVWCSEHAQPLLLWLSGSLSKSWDPQVAIWLPAAPRSLPRLYEFSWLVAQQNFFWILLGSWV